MKLNFYAHTLRENSNVNIGLPEQLDELRRTSVFFFVRLKADEVCEFRARTLLRIYGGEFTYNFTSFLGG